MKRQKTHLRRHGLQHRLPLLSQVVELLVAIVVFAGGQSLWAVLASASPDITPPSVPANVHLVARSATEIDLAWDASTDDTAVAGYKLFRDGAQIATPTTNSYADLNLTPNTTYSYTVTAYDAVPNESAASSAFSTGTLADTTPPSVPTNLRQTGATISTVTIAWNPSSDNVAVAGYNVFRNGRLVRSQTGTSFTDTGLAVYTGYVYSVTAYDASNNASNVSSNLVGSTDQDTTAPSVPDNLHQTGSTITSVTLTWDDSTDDVSVTGYNVYRDGSLVGSPAGASFTDSGLAVNSHYTYTVSAHDAANNTSAASAPFTANSAPDTTPPTTPANLHSTTILDTSITLAWDDSTDNVGVVAYKVYRNGVLVGSPTSSGFTDSGLSPVTSYDYTVKAVDAAGNASPASATRTVVTAYDTTAPSAPTNLRSTGQTDTSVSLAWDASSDNVGVSGYDIYRGSTLLATTIGTTFTDSGLSVQTVYTYKVRAHDSSANNSPDSTPLTTSTLADTVAPTTPGGLTASAATTTGQQLDWNAATDDVAVASYKLYRNGAVIYTGTGLTYGDSALHYNRSYSYQVTSLDASGNESPLSTAVSASTLPDTVAPIVSLTAPGSGNVKLTFPITGSASDDLDLARIDIFADTTKIATFTSGNFSFNWDSYAVHNGTRVITARAYDVTGNSSSFAVTVNVANPPPPLLGDLNGDHKVNIFDLSILLSNFKKSGNGDFNNNGKVDIFDLSVLLSRYGQDNSGYN